MFKNKKNNKKTEVVVEKQKPGESDKKQPEQIINNIEKEIDNLKQVMIDFNKGVFSLEKKVREGANKSENILIGVQNIDATIQEIIEQMDQMAVLSGLHEKQILQLTRDILILQTEQELSRKPARSFGGRKKKKQAIINATQEIYKEYVGKIDKASLKVAQLAEKLKK